MKRNCLRHAVVACTLCISGLVSADVIYDNTDTFTGSRSFTALQIGDEVAAAGSARLVTQLQIGVTMQDRQGTADLQAFLYANDGQNGQPGTLLWESELMQDVPLSGGDDLIPFDVHGVEVPDTFTWTIQVSDAQPVAGGVPHYFPPSIGTSPDYGWFGQPGSWTKLDLGDPVDFMAIVIAESAGGFALSVDATCPRGGPATADWTGATPDGRVALVFAANTGSFVVPNGPCAGAQLGLGSRGIRLVSIEQSDADGSGALEATAPAAACGAFLQLLDLESCATSNVATIE